MNSFSIFNNFLWRFSERIGAQGVRLIVELILARFLLPEVYGIVTLVTIFITILNVFVDSGLANALIQKKNVDDCDFSSVFYFNILVCSLLYTLLFLSAPSIATFYRMPALTHIFRVLGLQIIISALKNVQQAYLARNLQFKKFFFATLGGTIGAAFVGIIMVYKGFGVWALVAQQLFNTIIDTLLLWLIVKWRPHLVFSFNRLLGLLSYGWKLLASALLDAGYNNLRSLIIGKVYSSSDLAFYNRGQQFPNFIVANINTSIDSVLLPTMSREQDHVERIKDMTRRAIKTSTYLMMPSMMLLAVCAESIVRIILTEKWLPSVFFLRVFCFDYAFYPLHTANLNAIKALGKSELFLRLEILKKIVGLIALFSTMFISVKAMAYSSLVISVINQIINSWPNKRLLGYKYTDQLKDMLPQITISLLMGIIVFWVKFLQLTDWLTLILQFFLGIILYILMSSLFHIDSLVVGQKSCFV